MKLGKLNFMVYSNYSRRGIFLSDKAEQEASEISPM